MGVLRCRSQLHWPVLLQCAGSSGLGLLWHLVPLVPLCGEIQPLSLPLAGAVGLLVYACMCMLPPGAWRSQMSWAADMGIACAAWY
jgi:hypothetical protein